MIKKTYQFKASSEDVWSALTDKFVIREWTGYDAVMEPKAGTQFSLWEGDIHGTNIEVVPEQKLVQNWFGGEWDAPSIVTFTLRPEGTGCTLELEHTGVPADEEADFDIGWDDYYIGAIMELLQPEDFEDIPKDEDGFKFTEYRDPTLIDDLARVADLQEAKAERDAQEGQSNNQNPPQQPNP